MSGGSAPPGGLGCEEALTRIYEYLDGELDPDVQERMHRHLEACGCCYPRFDIERRFLDDLPERSLLVEENRKLQTEIVSLLNEID